MLHTQPGYLTLLLAADSIQLALDIRDIINLAHIYCPTSWIWTTPDVPPRFRRPQNSQSATKWLRLEGKRGSAIFAQQLSIFIYNYMVFVLMNHQSFLNLANLPVSKKDHPHRSHRRLLLFWTTPPPIIFPSTSGSFQKIAEILLKLYWNNMKQMSYSWSSILSTPDFYVMLKKSTLQLFLILTFSSLSSNQ